MLTWEEINSLSIFDGLMDLVPADLLNKEPENILLFGCRDSEYLNLVFLVSDFVASTQTVQRKVEFVDKDKGSHLYPAVPISCGIYSCNRTFRELVLLNNLILSMLEKNDNFFIAYITNGRKIALAMDQLEKYNAHSVRILIFHFNYYEILDRFIEQILQIQSVKMIIIDSILSSSWLQSDITFSDRNSLIKTMTKLKEKSRNGCTTILLNRNQDKMISFMVDDHCFPEKS